MEVTHIQNPYKFISSSVMQSFEQAIQEWYTFEAREIEYVPNAKNLTSDRENVFFDELIACAIATLAESNSWTDDTELHEQLLKEYYLNPYEINDSLESDAYIYLTNHRMFHVYKIEDNPWYDNHLKYHEDDYIENSPLAEVW